MAETPTVNGRSPNAGENFAHPLYQLLGAPLLALVQAESQAAIATAEFIQHIGFETQPNTVREQGTSDLPTQAAGFESLGNLRMAEFSNTMPGPDGKQRSMNIQVPLLSLVPIPALQIKDAELEFYVRILDVSKGKSSTNISPTRKVSASVKDTTQDVPDDFLSQNRMQFRASMGRAPTSSQNQSSMEAQIKIKISMGQADIPVGLSKLFNIMDQSVSMTQSESR